MSPGFIERIEGKVNYVTRVDAGKEENIVVANVRCDSSEDFTVITPNVPPNLIDIKKYSSENDRNGITIDKSRTIDVRGPQIVEVTSPLLGQTYKISHSAPSKEKKMGNIPR